MKKITTWSLIVLGILFVIMKGLEWSIESKFQDIINSDPDRAYNITYADFDLGTFFKGMTLHDIGIEPLNPGKGTIIKGHVDYATINGIIWREFLFSKKLNLDEIAFEQPLFEITFSADTIQKTSGRGLQEMFGDILSRADLNSFRIQNGEVILRNPISQDIKGQIKRINILATEIETDSLKFNQIIPFELGGLTVDIESATFKPNDYTDISLGRFRYNLMDKEMLLNDISLGYSLDWVEVSKRTGVQKDIIELNVKEIGIHKLEPSSNFYTHLDIDAQKLSIDELGIKLQRNKNISRPTDAVKPMFQGIINSIPIQILIDSIQISNSSVTYSELGVNKNESGSIEFTQINGTITGLTNMPEQQRSKDQLNANINARLKGKAEIQLALNVPYQNSRFSLDLDVGKMNLTNLNPTLSPLAGVEMVSGKLSLIKFQMAAGPIHSQNKLIFDYSDLQIKLINKKNKNKSKNKDLLSTIANTAIRANNLPGQHKYIATEYQFKRNINRSPINYIIKALMYGVTKIVPEKSVQKILNKQDKKGKKSKK
ncbi:MAG: DUF748 domain-containing protein [Flavobacteriaceae bacterium]|nr:DUF748 domain-containing protein [Flavobacteriaceae bacterium]